MIPLHRSSQQEDDMKYATTLFVALGFAALAQPAAAKSVWDQLSESAPRMELPAEQVEMTAPRSSVFDDLQKTAPRADIFDELNKTAP
jgi:hypothetical protein